MVNTENDAIAERYFDIVQNKIKELAAKNNDFSEEEAQEFNNAIFNQDDNEVMIQIKEYINKASDNNLDLDKVAKTLYDKFKLQVKNNLFNVDKINDIPNKLVDERKHIKTFEQFNNDNKV